MEWQPIETIPPHPQIVIGLRKWPENEDYGVICGTQYDMNPSAVMDWQRGRWMICTHWAYPPQ